MLPSYVWCTSVLVINCSASYHGFRFWGKLKNRKKMDAKWWPRLEHAYFVWFWTRTEKFHVFSRYCCSNKLRSLRVLPLRTHVCYFFPLSLQAAWIQHGVPDHLQHLSVLSQGRRRAPLDRSWKGGKRRVSDYRVKKVICSLAKLTPVESTCSIVYYRSRKRMNLATLKLESAWNYLENCNS